MKIFYNPPYHDGKPLAGQCLDFMPSDSQERFLDLCQVEEYREYFHKQGWLEPGAISYKINSYGFRCDEFGGKDCIVTLGCSFTMGIGLPVQDTWPQLLGKKLQITPYNLAWGGAAADTCFRLAEYWLPALRPKAVFMLTPPPSRFELIKAQQHPPVEVYMPSNSGDDSTRDIGSFLQHWYTMDENSRLNNTKNKLAIRALCDKLNLPCLIYDAFSHMSKSREEVGYARDRMHAGPLAHTNLVERMFNDWHEKHA
jgi:hypothetical protein